MKLMKYALTAVLALGLCADLFCMNTIKAKKSYYQVAIENYDQQEALLRNQYNEKKIEESEYNEKLEVINKERELLRTKIKTACFFNLNNTHITPDNYPYIWFLVNVGLVCSTLAIAELVQAKLDNDGDRFLVGLLKPSALCIVLLATRAIWENSKCEAKNIVKS